MVDEPSVQYVRGEQLFMCTCIGITTSLVGFVYKMPRCLTLLSLPELVLLYKQSIDFWPSSCMQITLNHGCSNGTIWLVFYLFLMHYLLVFVSSFFHIFYLTTKLITVNYDPTEARKMFVQKEPYCKFIVIKHVFKTDVKCYNQSYSDFLLLRA